jgi:hypothetical protein
VNYWPIALPDILTQVAPALPPFEGGLDGAGHDQIVTRALPHSCDDPLFPSPLSGEDRGAELLQRPEWMPWLVKA